MGVSPPKRRGNPQKYKGHYGQLGILNVFDVAGIDGVRHSVHNRSKWSFSL